ncbi:MAG: Bug family tripartite tricarboxylate transporter substrate binding protein, partial [Terriglobales bacterium]
LGGTAMKTACPVASALLLALLVAPAPAQDTWPSRPVRLVVPSSPGGGTDTYARLLAQGLGEALKRQFIVDNRPGASGNVGAEIAARAAPDGYAFLVSASPVLVINPSLYKKLPYDVERDFTPVARGVISPDVWTSHPSVPVKTLAALVALGKREPGRLTFGSPGVGSPPNLAVKVVEEVSGARFVHVPYKGGGQAVQGLLSGEIAFMVSGIISAQPHVQSGKVLALAASHRVRQLPGTPTYGESGYPNIESIYSSFSVVAPAGTPPAIVRRMSAEIAALMKSPAFRERLDAQALIPVFDTPNEFAATLKKERARYAEIIRRNNIVAD